MVMKRMFLMSTAFLAMLASAQVVEDFKPASTNQEGQEYPMVNSQRMVRARISAPDANSVKLDIGGVKYDLVKDAEGKFELKIGEGIAGMVASTGEYYFVEDIETDVRFLRPNLAEKYADTKIGESELLVITE